MNFIFGQFLKKGDKIWSFIPNSLCSKKGKNLGPHGGVLLGHYFWT